MAYLVVLVLDNPDQCPDVLRAWDEAGVPGATILESTGLARLQKAIWDDLPLVPSVRDLLGTRELHHRTLFTIVRDEEVIVQNSAKGGGEREAYLPAVLAFLPQSLRPAGGPMALPPGADDSRTTPEVGSH